MYYARNHQLPTRLKELTMRTTLSLVLSLMTVLATANQPNATYLTTCRDAYAPVNPEVPLSRQIELDLINGQWEQSNLLIYFNEDGTSDWLTEHHNGRWTYQEKPWTMSGTADTPLLEVEQENGATDQYFIEPTCQGVMLQKTATTEVLQLDFNPASTSRQQQVLQKELSGSWEHLLTPAQVKELDVLDAEDINIHQAKVRLYFTPNGIFTKELICAEANIHIRETGTWKVSRDGQFILLNDLHGIQPEDSRCIRLKYLELDELVLEQALAFADTKGALSRQDFYFNKH